MSPMGVYLILLKNKVKVNALFFIELRVKVPTDDLLL